jgi:hypothetical protein
MSFLKDYNLACKTLIINGLLIIHIIFCEIFGLTLIELRLAYAQIFPAAVGVQKMSPGTSRVENTYQAWFHY